MDYGARWYDPSIGRWNAVDALADDPNQVDKSPYAYTWNNPINLTDPDGNCPNCVTAIGGAIAGGFIGGVVEIGSQLWNEGSVSDWKAVKGSAVQGAITGGAAGFTGGGSLLVTSTVAGGANVVGGIANRSIQDQETTVSDVATDAAMGVGLNLAGAVAGKIVENSVDNLSPAAKGKLGEAATQVKYGARGYKSTGKSNVPTGGRTPTGRRQVARYDHKMENIVTGSKKTVESKFNSARLSRNQRAARGNITTPGGLFVDRTTSQQFGDVTRAGVLGTAGQFNKKEE